MWKKPASKRAMSSRKPPCRHELHRVDAASQIAPVGRHVGGPGQAGRQPDDRDGVIESARSLGARQARGGGQRAFASVAHGRVDAAGGWRGRRGDARFGALHQRRRTRRPARLRQHPAGALGDQPCQVAHGRVVVEHHGVQRQAEGAVDIAHDLDTRNRVGAQLAHAHIEIHLVHRQVQHVAYEALHARAQISAGRRRLCGRRRQRCGRRRCVGTRPRPSLGHGTQLDLAHRARRGSLGRSGLGCARRLGGDVVAPQTRAHLRVPDDLGVHRDLTRQHVGQCGEHRSRQLALEHT